MSTLTSLFGDIADSIRAKKGTTAQITASDFPSEIMSIPTGSAPTGTKSISITQNGTQTVDVSGYANAQIATNVSGYTPTGHRDYLITTNTGRIDDNVSGLASISIIVNVPQSATGYYGELQGSSYQTAFYDTASNEEYYYFAMMPVNVTDYTHVVVMQNTTSPAPKVLAVGYPKSSSAVKWQVFNTNGTLIDNLQLNGNRIPLQNVSQSVIVYAVK